MQDDIEERYYDLLRSFVKLLELRNPFNIDHCELVAHYCGELAHYLRFADADVRRLVKAAEIHTLGVLLQMEEKHPQRNLPISGLQGRTGRDVSIHTREEQIFRGVLSGIRGLDGCLEILEQRHEWYDGTGSIAKLKGNAICKEARLMAVIDAYVDLVTPKAHRPPETTSTAVGRLQELAGLQFDPAFVSALRDYLSERTGLGNSGTDRKFQVAHCRHYLNLGHFYTQIHETEWALRSYLAAERMAARMEDPGLALGAISGQFMVYCERLQLERAREILQQVRHRSVTDSDRLGYQMLWGLLEWLEAKPLGKEILEKLIRRYESLASVPDLTAALSFQTCMTLFTQGGDNPEHLDYLTTFMKLVGRHDVFDIVERYRPYTIPIFLNAIVHEVDGRLARNLLTRMGEPCHGPLLDRLSNIPPAQWTKVLMSTPVLGEPAEAPQFHSGHQPLYIETLGKLCFRFGECTAGAEVFPTLKTIKLFLRLAFAGGRSVSSDMLAEELWPDAGPKKGRDSLRNSLAQVRRALRSILGDESREVVSRKRKDTSLTLDFPCRFDFQDFEETYARTRLAFTEGQPHEAMMLAQASLRLYNGDMLESFDEDWVVAMRFRLAAMRTQALTIVARCHILACDYAQAEQCARDLLCADDLREESHILLLEALAGQGRPAEAIAHYEQAQKIFENEIGIFPERVRSTLKELDLLL